MSGVGLALLLIVVVLVVLLVLGVPIAVVLGLSSIAGILPTLDLASTVVTASQRLFSGVSTFTLLAIPFFILAGNIMNQGGIALRLVNFARMIVGPLPGGLAITNILANMMFGSISGSGVAAASAMGSILGPEMVKEGYDKNYAAATNAASAPTGLLIPPSNVLITYSLISGGTSVAALFVAGYLPGFLWGLACMVIGVIVAKQKGFEGSKRVTGKEALDITKKAIPSLLLVVIVIGGIILGIFTATEAACIAVVYSVILSIIYKNLNFETFIEACRNAVETTAIIMLLIGASNIMGWVFSFTGIPQLVANTLLGITENKIIILLLMNLILLVVGTFMDITPAVLIFTPIFLPIVESFGMHPVQFGIMITYNLCIGGITPPVGNMLYVSARVGDTSVEGIMPWLVRFYIGILVILLAVTFIPQISLILPSAAGLI